MLPEDLSPPSLSLDLAMAAFQLGGMTVGPVYMLHAAIALPVTVAPQTPRPINTAQLQKECRQIDLLPIMNLLEP